MSSESREVTCTCGHNDDEHNADDSCQRCGCKQYLSQYDYDLAHPPQWTEYLEDDDDGA